MRGPRHGRARTNGFVDGNGHSRARAGGKPGLDSSTSKACGCTEDGRKATVKISPKTDPVSLIAPEFLIAAVRFMRLWEQVKTRAINRISARCDLTAAPYAISRQIV